MKRSVLLVLGLGLAILNSAIVRAENDPPGLGFVRVAAENAGSAFLPAVWNALVFDKVETDLQGEYVRQSATFVARAFGLYQISANVGLAPILSGSRIIPWMGCGARVLLNSAGASRALVGGAAYPNATSTNACSVNLTTTVLLRAGDQISVGVFPVPTENVATRILPGGYNNLSVVRIR